MKLWDYHTHNYLCNHAKGTVEDYVKSAIEKGLCEIGLSDHFPMHLMTMESNVEQWAMSMEQFPKYLAKCQAIQAKYKEDITVRIATELDFTPSSFLAYKQELRPFLGDLDYLIGSVHVVDLDGVGERGIDGPDSLTLMKEVGADIIYKHYYKDNLQMVKTGFYNIVGHCDLPKKFGILPSEEVWEGTLKFLDAVENSEMAVEINHAGYYKPVGVQYPDDRIIEELILRDIPLTFGSDAHDPSYVAYRFEETLQKLQLMQKRLKKSVYLAKFTSRKMLTKIAI